MHGAKISKSRGNVVNPDEYLAQYGADALRVFLMFLGPFDQKIEFSDRGMTGVCRFLRRVWHLVLSQPAAGAEPDHHAVALHALIRRVSVDIEQLHYNTAIAALMAYVNERAMLDEQAVSVILRLLAPFAPHITEELWSRIGQPYSIHQQSWPVADSMLLSPTNVPVAVQLNGRTRAILRLAPDASREDALAAARDILAVAPHLDGAARVIYRPGRVLNVVT
jgi:leucyl-tRNA synthetase